ncbi:MAG: hypothetical protein AB3N24_10630 [Leisingera sp.]
MAKVEGIVPDAENFRQWLGAALSALGMKPAALARRSGAPINSAQKFLEGPQADLRMNTASKLCRQCFLEAQKKGVTLPPLMVEINLKAEGDE